MDTVILGKLVSLQIHFVFLLKEWELTLLLESPNFKVQSEDLSLPWIRLGECPKETTGATALKWQGDRQDDGARLECQGTRTPQSRLLKVPEGSLCTASYRHSWRELHQVEGAESRGLKRLGKKMKPATGMEGGAGDQALALTTSVAACPIPLRKRTKKVREKNDTFSNQSTIRYQVKEQCAGGTATVKSLGRTVRHFGCHTSEQQEPVWETLSDWGDLLFWDETCSRKNKDKIPDFEVMLVVEAGSIYTFFKNEMAL